MIEVTHKAVHKRPTETEAKVAVRFSAVSYSYGEIPVLHNVDFHFHEGEFVALVGPNGSGKTTVLRLILGLAETQAGYISVLGGTPKEARSEIGYVPQNAVYDPAFPISVADVVRMGRLRSKHLRYNQADRAAADRALVLADIGDLAGRAYSALSGGQRRRVLVARALAAEPRFLILDEPTANMDADSENRLYRALGSLKGKTTILVVTHDNGFVSALTDTILCAGGRDNQGHRAEGNIVRHRSVPAREAPKELFGGDALKVLHDTALPANDCGKKEE